MGFGTFRKRLKASIIRPFLVYPEELEESLQIYQHFEFASKASECVGHSLLDNVIMCWPKVENLVE